MAQRLQLKLTQKLGLAPQLQQAIRLLQLNRLELREYLQQAIDANPLLERDTDNQETSLDNQDHAQEQTYDEQTDYSDYADSGEDAAWELEGFSISSGEDTGNIHERTLADHAHGSLQEHLLWQINLSSFNEEDTAIAHAIVYALDEDGFLPDSLDDIRASLAPEFLIQATQVETVLKRIQRMEPVGIASRSTQECLIIQLQALSTDTPQRELALRLARNYLDVLADYDIDVLSKQTAAKNDQVHTAIQLIHSLEPRPGARFSNRDNEYLVPDIYVRKHAGEWQVSLSPDHQPQLKINDYYIKLLKQAKGQDAKYLQGQLQEARWLINSLDLRNHTLVQIATAIVEIQEGFLELGESAMRPLILKDIAEKVGVHESTVSRATTRKYMLTPSGLFELKYFFSSAVTTYDGNKISATAVKSLMVDIISNENGKKPFSDNKITGLLRESGINIARRTIAKYRESMGIGSSSERRRLTQRRENLEKHAPKTS